MRTTARIRNERRNRNFMMVCSNEDFSHRHTHFSGKEVHSPHTAKSFESGKLTKTSKSTLTVQNPHTSGDAFMAAFQPKLEKKKENVHRPKPFTVPAPTPSVIQPKNEPVRIHSGKRLSLLTKTHVLTV